jgi:hypothetical protein
MGVGVVVVVGALALRSFRIWAIMHGIIEYRESESEKRSFCFFYSLP